jgi:hypothetical protein
MSGGVAQVLRALPQKKKKKKSERQKNIESLS